MVKPAEQSALRVGEHENSANKVQRIAGTPVAVWGEAWTTALGSDISQVWQRLLRGETGFADVEDPVRLRNQLAALVPEPTSTKEPVAQSPSQHLRSLATDCIRRTLSSLEPLEQLPPIDLVIGTSLGDFLENSSCSNSLHAWAQDVACSAGIAGQVISLSTACSSSADAILVAAELIRSGASQICVCGGADVVSSVKRQGHSGLGTMSPTRLRPFDQDHDGTLLGEGAAFLLLVSPEMHSRLKTTQAGQGNKHEQGKPVWLRGVGSANDGASMSGPDPEGRGARFAIERSLADAGLSAADIQVINAHGSGTPLNDETEVNTYLQLFSAQPETEIFATKGAFGHTLGATGAMEAIALIQALRSGLVPPIAGLEQPVCSREKLKLAFRESRQLAAHARFGLSLTLGFGGFDTSLVFEVEP